MSYDITVVDGGGNSVILKEKHHFIGGTFGKGGTDEAYINMTYNYSGILSKVFKHAVGIRLLHGMPVKSSLPLISEAIKLLDDDIVDDYWEATEGNVKAALTDLRDLLSLVPKDSSSTIQIT